LNEAEISMLTRVEIENFRSCSNVTIDKIGQIVALIGRNAAGKSNILQAIRWMANSATTPPSLPTFWRFFRESRKPSAVTVHAKLARRSYVFRFRVSPSAPGPSGAFSPVELHESLSIQEPGGGLQEVFNRAGQQVASPLLKDRIQIGTLAPSLPTLTALLPAAKLVELIRPLTQFLERIRYYPLDEATDIRDDPSSGLITEEAYKHWLGHYKETGDPGDAIAMRLLYMHLEDQAQLQQVNSLLGASGLGVIERAAVASGQMMVGGTPEEQEPRPVPFYQPIFLLPHDADQTRRRTFNYAELSFGTRRVVRMIVSLVFDHSNVMLVEHPEDGIHTGLVRKVIDLLRANLGETQLIMSSHSLTVMNALAPGDVRLVAMADGETRVRALTPKQLRTATEFITKEGGSLADFLESVED
jgi:energy-coupling factor transporter ATP-binding protein EcfA2